MPTSTTALLIIDVQQAIDHPGRGARNNPDAETRIARLLDAWRRQGRPIAHIRHLSRSPDSSYAPGQPGYEFKPQAAPLAGEQEFIKHTHNAFLGTWLDHWLRENHIDTVAVAGIATNHAVAVSARMAADLGFHTWVVADACAAFDLCGQDGRLWPAEDVHALSLASLQDGLARVTSSDQLLA